MTTTFLKHIIATALAFAGISATGQNKMGERRVYYLDATYSMITPSKLWNPVRNDLEKAINAIEDEDTEIYVVAFGGNNGEELRTWHGHATPDGKRSIVSGFQSFDPQRNTMTYLDRPLTDFYREKVAQDRVTYCFLMTDGRDENKDPNMFYDSLRQWGNRYKDSNVYGFYVMLNREAKDNSIESIINTQEHLWKVESADVNINLIRLDNKALFNVRSDDFIELPISGNTSGLKFKASFPQDCDLIANSCEVKDGKLRVSVSVKRDCHRMPESFSNFLTVELTNGGDYDFLVTDNVDVECCNNRERILRTPADAQDFGKVNHHDAFFFVPGKIKPVKKTLQFGFNSEAKDDSGTFAELKFVDKKGNDVSAEDMIITVNGVTLADNSFRITSSDDDAEIEISFTPGARKGKHKGYLRIVASNLQRVNNDICAGGSIDACTWVVHNNKTMNPLKLALISLLAVLLTAFALWIFILKPVFYPKFGSVQKVFSVPGMAPLMIKFKGARKVIVSANPQKRQSAWNRFWTGKIIYKVHPAFVAPIVFKPSRGRKVLAMVQSNSYRVQPNPMPCIGSASIIDIQRNCRIVVN